MRYTNPHLLYFTLLNSASSSCVVVLWLVEHLLCVVNTVVRAAFCWLHQRVVAVFIKKIHDYSVTHSVYSFLLS